MPEIALIVFGLLGAGFVAGLTFLLYRTEQKRAKASADLGLANARLAALAADAADLKSTRSERDTLKLTLERERAEARSLERRIADLMEAKDQMRQAFSETAGALMASHSETFKNQNKDQIESLLGPLKDNIDSFRKALGDAHAKSGEQHAALKEQIEQNARQYASGMQATENLTRALKGNVQMQGAWGEMIVDTILSRLGLREGIEFSRQETHAGEEGRLRTDYIVRLPQGDPVIIDSKVSLVDFERFVNAADDDARERHLAAHARSLRAHVKTLASKEYQTRVGARLDFVILFVPIEGALSAALAADETLALDALDRKVAIATPTTLTTTLQTIDAMWKVERQNENAEAIADRAGRLYDKFVNFIGDLTGIGERIVQAGTSYEKALAKLTGAGGLVRQAEMLKAMGAKTAKALPPDLLDRADAGEREELLRIERDPAAAAAAE